MRDDGKPNYATISKNIANFPIARDMRVKLS